MLRRISVWRILCLAALLTVLAAVPASAALSAREKQQIAAEILIDSTQLVKMAPNVSKLTERLMKDPQDAGVSAECISMLKVLYPINIRALERINRAGRDDIRFFYMMWGVCQAADSLSKAVETLKETYEASHQLTDYEIRCAGKLARLFQGQGDAWLAQTFILVDELDF